VKTLFGLDRVLLTLAARIAALVLVPKVLPVDEAEQLRGRGRRVFYVLEERTLSDQLALILACRQLGLPSPARRMLVGGQVERHAMVFMRRSRGWFTTRADRRLPVRLQRLVDATLAAGDRDIDLIPVAVFWGRAPQRESAWWRTLFAEGWSFAGRFRRFLAVLVNGRATAVHFGEPLPLEAEPGEAGDAGRVARRLARLVRLQLRQQRAATLGPDLSHQRTVIREVLRSRAVRAAVAAEVRSKNLTRRQALLQARGMANEIAAHYSHRFVSIMYRLLTKLWNRLYDGVDVFHAERLNLAASGAQVVYVPCHRSHMDYLLLSYVIYHRGHAVPHVAAGVNLNMPIIGRFLRMGGAFFLRRSFKGNAVYPAVFTKYLAVMMARGHSIEYFIEGGRSRTGRLLEPKTGMLSMTVRAFLRDPRRPVVFVPVYFGYERLMEGQTYLGELSGKAKKSESVGDLLRILPRLRERYGRVQVSFGEPLDLATLVRAHAPDWRENPTRDEARPPWLGGVIDDLANIIMRRINAAAAVTPTNLLATVLLSMPRQALPETDLVRQIELYQKLLGAAPYGPDSSCTALDGAGIVAHGEAMGMLERRQHPLGDILRMREKQAVLATYARNNTLHLLAMPSFLACAFLNNPSLPEADLQRLAWRIYPYAAQELFLHFTELRLPEVVEQCLAALAQLGLLRREETAEGVVWCRAPTGTAEAVQLSILAHTTISTVERFYLALALLIKAGSGELSQDALEMQCVHQASRMSVLYGLDSPDFFDRAMFRSFLDLLREREILHVDARGKLTFDEILGPIIDDARRVLSEQIRHSVLQVTHG